MGSAAVRIGRVRMKDGGADVHILRQDTREDGENYKGLIVKHARIIADDPAEMIGFVVVGIFADGSYSHGLRLDKDAAIGRMVEGEI